jgi:hypothetical protein
MELNSMKNICSDIQPLRGCLAPQCNIPPALPEDIAIQSLRDCNWPAPSLMTPKESNSNNPGRSPEPREWRSPGMPTGRSPEPREGHRPATPPLTPKESNSNNPGCSTEQREVRNPGDNPKPRRGMITNTIQNP